MTAIIETEQLSRTFKDGGRDIQAVKGLDLSIEAGGIFGFLGPNGAGKSTTINMLCTLVKPTGGKARVAGIDVTVDPHAVRQRIGLVFQDPSLDERLTGWENLSFHAMLYGVPRRIWKQRATELLEMVALSDRKDDMVRGYSGGMKRRLEIARGLLHHPDLLFLDEPTLGLDPQTRNLMWDYILDLQQRQGLTIFLTTHYMEEAEHCHRIAIMDRGELIALDTPDALKAGVGTDTITIGVDNPQAAIRHIEKTFDVDVRQRGDELKFQVTDGAAFLPKLIAEPALTINRVQVHRPTLEDVFLSLTGNAIMDESPDHFASIKASTRRGGRK